MKLLDTTGGNPKLGKTTRAGFDHGFGEIEGAAVSRARVAGLSLHPDPVLCAGSKAAGCMPECLRNQGRGKMDSVTGARQARADWFYSDPVAFLTQLKGELENFRDTCRRSEVLPFVRLNVLSDVEWEKYGVPQAFPEILFYDYTKLSARLCKTPDNYRLIFSYSGRPQYARQVSRAMATGLPVAVVFRGGLPAQFLGRRVIDGDRSDILNYRAAGKIVGLRAKGTAARDRSGFVIDNPEMLAVAS